MGDLTFLHTAFLDWVTPDAEQIIARHARVSTKNPDRGEFKQLIKYCINHGHWSVFEQVNASYNILTSRSISAQIIRHRSFSFQELSQRYTDPTDTLDTITNTAWRFDLRKQDTKNRQNSTDDLDTAVINHFHSRLGSLYHDILDLYKEMLDAGVAKECARNILPMCTPTRLHVNGTLRSWIHYVGLRGAHGTQQEHREIVKQIRHSLEQIIPCVTEAITRYVDEVKPPNMDGWASSVL